MSTHTPTPARKLTPPGFATLVARLTAEGWRTDVPNPPRGRRRPAFALVARRGAERTRPSDRAEVAVLHGYVAPDEIRLDDVWRIVAQMNDVQGDGATILLEEGCVVSSLARETADRIGVKIRTMGGSGPSAPLDLP